MFYQKRLITIIVTLLIVIIMLLIVNQISLSKKSLILSPQEKNGITAFQTADVDIIKNIEQVKRDKISLAQNQQNVRTFLSAKDTKKDYETIMRRFLENSFDFSADSPVRPIKLDIEDYDVLVSHGERVSEEGVEIIETVFELVNKQQSLEERQHLKVNFINDNSYTITVGSIFESDVYQIENQAYAIIKVPASLERAQESSSKSPLTGYQVYSPPVSFNQVNRNFAVIIPYSTAVPLPPNAVSYLQTKLNTNVVPYFQANSEGTATYTFTIYPVSVAGFDPSQGFYIDQIIAAADPTINYSQYDMALLHIPGLYGGFATMQFTQQGTIAYFPTNEPLRAVVPIIFFDSSDPDLNQVTEFVTQHEMGHDLTAFNPSVNWNYFSGFLPHARGFDQYSYPCTTNGPVIFCNPWEYGDQLDVMGTGRGLFSHHRAVHDLGFRNPNSVQSVTASGTYTLCDTNHAAPANCPQELLIQNPNGANMAIELIATPLGPQYSLYQNCQNFFDSLILRITDIEQGGGLGNIVYSSPFFGGDVVYPASSALSTCISPWDNSTMLDFPLHQGQSVTTPVGVITFQSLTNTATGKQATISLASYTTPSCVTGSPIIQLAVPNIPQIYAQTLWPVDPYRIYQTIIQSGSSCPAPDIVTLTTQVTVAGTIHTNTISLPLPFNSAFTQDVVFPQSLANVPLGTYPFTVTATPTSAPTQTSTVSGQIEIVAYTPQIYAIAQTSYCLDLDTIPFTWQNLGANYQSPYPNIGAVVTLNPPIAGLPPTLYVPDYCTSPSGVKASDVICSQNIPGAPPNYGVILYQDCRFEMNNQNAYCYNGVCY